MFSNQLLLFIGEMERESFCNLPRSNIQKLTEVAKAFKDIKYTVANNNEI